MPEFIKINIVLKYSYLVGNGTNGTNGRFK